MRFTAVQLQLAEKFDETDGCTVVASIEAYLYLFGTPDHARELADAIKKAADERERELWAAHSSRDPFAVIGGQMDAGPAGLIRPQPPAEREVEGEC